MSRGVTALVVLLVVAMVSADSSDADQSRPLIGRPDGHEPGVPAVEDPVIGKPDGHEPVEDPVIGKPDGHEPGVPATGSNGPLIGAPDGHDSGHVSERPVIGKPDGHEPGVPAEGDSQKPVIGRPDGHEPADTPDDETDGNGNDEDAEEADDNENDEDENYDVVDRPAVDESSDDTDISPFQFNTDEDYAYDDMFGEGEIVGMPIDSDLDNYSEDDEDANKPLVRCKRPLCEQECPNGFEMDSLGCPTCRCLVEEAREGSDGTSLIGRPDGHDNPCARRPLCRMYCESGFMTGDDGCPVCSCLDNPCATRTCPEGQICRANPCVLHPCTSLTAECFASIPRVLPCPEPMCANYCPGGYKRNDAGCMTCECAEVPKERICGEITCGEGQVCRNKTVDATTVKKVCTVKTLCENLRDKPQGLGAVKPECEADGSFKPLQCNHPAAECWCVDGRGQEVDGTRSPVYVEEHKPNCVRNNTVSMHIHMTLIVRHDIDIDDQLNSLNATIVDHVSTWLLIEPHYIRLVKAKTSSADGDDSNGVDGEDGDGSDDEDDEDDDEDGQRIIVVEVVVFHDGVTDLPSAADYMQRRMHQGHCHITMGDNLLEPDANLMQTDHKFAYEPVQTAAFSDEPLTSRRMMMRYGVCTTGGLFILLVICAVVMVAVHRRRGQFRHHQLQSQASISSEKNLLAGAVDEYTPAPVLKVDADDLVATEKEPMA